MPRSIETQPRSSGLVSPCTGTLPGSNANAGAPDNSRPASEETDASLVKLDRKTQHPWSSWTVKRSIPGLALDRKVAQHRTVEIHLL